MKKLIDQIEQNLLHQFKTDEELIKELKVMNDLFVKDRSQLNQNYQSEKSISAYTYFYGLSNLFKIFDLEKKIQFSSFLESSIEFFDFGCGPGIYSLAIKEILGDRVKRYNLIDQNPIMLSQAKKILKSESTHFLANVCKPEKNLESLFLYGNSLNEIDEKVFQYNHKQVEPNYYMIIEPGTKQSFVKFLKFRQFLLGQGYNAIYPCLHGDLCPLENQEDNWCHQYTSISLVQDISQNYSRICQKLNRKRNHMPVLFAFFSKEKLLKKREKILVFIVRDYKKNKAFHYFDVCYQDKSHVEKIKILRRNFSKTENKEIELISSGDIVQIDKKGELIVGIHKKS